jgi:hypothetical protein
METAVSDFSMASSRRGRVMSPLPLMHEGNAISALSASRKAGSQTQTPLGFAANQ